MLMSRPAISDREGKRLRQAGSLAAIAEELQSNHDLLAQVGRLLSAHIGTDVRHVRSEWVMPPRPDLSAYIKSSRTHTRHHFELSRPNPDFDGRAYCQPSMAQSGQLTVFLKAGSNVVCSPVERIINEEKVQRFSSPYFFGSLETHGLRVGVWEFVDGARTPFEALPLEAQLQLVRSIAGVNSISREDCAPVGTKWILTPLQRYEKIYRKMDAIEQDEWQSLLQGTREVLHNHEVLIDRMQSMGEVYLTHNDINPNNVFVGEGGDVVILDWEAATRSAPGADLRFLWRMETREALLACYIEQMGKFGIHLKVEDVQAAYEIVEGFRMIQKGWGKRKASPVKRGLELLSARLG
ncbi:MAG: phosphotransferase [Enhydrobacter sp.]|nr:phosphotransferase [Enhydrobacter sp.]